MGGYGFSHEFDGSTSNPSPTWPPTLSPTTVQTSSASTPVRQKATLVANKLQDVNSEPNADYGGLRFNPITNSWMTQVEWDKLILIAKERERMEAQGFKWSDKSGKYEWGGLTPQEWDELRAAGFGSGSGVAGGGGSSGGGGGHVHAGGGGGGASGSGSTREPYKGDANPAGIYQDALSGERSRIDQLLKDQRSAREADKLAADAQREADQVRERQSAFAVLKEVLDLYGLGDLGDWAWDQLQNNRSRDEVLLELRKTDTFKDRFKAIEIRKQNGLNAVSPETIIDYENTARDLMRASGLPKGFYDEADDFANLIGKGVSLRSVQQRIEESWSRVVNAPPEVKQAWESIYGMHGEQAMATFMFDPDNSEAKLKQMASSAVAGGAMKAFGFDIMKDAAERVGGLDLSDSAVRQGFGRLAQLRSVFAESVGERRDLQMENEGINAVFDAGEGADDIERRITGRRNQFAGGGGAFLSQQGLAGRAQ